jgi:hypothetical protein
MADNQGMYMFFQSFEDYDWVEYGFILLIVLFFVTQILQPSWFFFVGAIMAIIIIYYRADEKYHTISTKNKELMMKLKSLTPKPANFHMDPDLINLYYNIRDFRTLNTEAYDQSLIAVDNMLKIVSEIEAGVYHCSENLDIVIDQMNKAMNHLHTTIYKMPIPKIVEMKYMQSLQALHIILRRHVDRMVDICQRQYKKRGIDINTHFVYNDGPRADDTQNEDYSNFNMYV